MRQATRYELVFGALSTRNIPGKENTLFSSYSLTHVFECVSVYTYKGNLPLSTHQHKAVPFTTCLQFQPIFTSISERPRMFNLSRCLPTTRKCLSSSICPRKTPSKHHNMHCFNWTEFVQTARNGSKKNLCHCRILITVVL